jgi:hypothetical protein
MDHCKKQGGKKLSSLLYVMVWNDALGLPMHELNNPVLFISYLDSGILLSQQKYIKTTLWGTRIPYKKL